MEITELIARCRRGDTDALSLLYATYQGRMRSICRRYVHDAQALDDVLHDAFVVILTSLDRLRDDTKAEAWMMAIARNVASRYREHLMAQPTVPIEEASAATEETEQPNVRGVPVEEVMRLIDRLPEGYGQVFRLSVFEGLTHREIADLLGIKAHSSSSQLARAKRMLRHMMLHYWALGLLLVAVIRINRPPAPPKEGRTSLPASEVTTPEKPLAQEPEENEQDTSTVAYPWKGLGKVAPSKPLAQETEDKPDTSKVAPPLERQEEVAPSRPLAQDQKDKQPAGKVTPTYEGKGEVAREKAHRWTVQLALAGPTDSQSRYGQPYAYHPSADHLAQSDATSGEAPTYAIPSSIENWSDYAMFLQNYPEAVSSQARAAVMRIALNNANRPGEDRILRTSRHRLPISWTLALKYQLSSRWGFETGLSYSRLSSTFEMGEDGNRIEERQTIHYLGLPLKGSCQLWSSRRWSLYGCAGISMEVPVYAPLYSSYYVRGTLEATDRQTLRAPWQLGIGTGVGMQLRLTPSIGLFTEPSLMYYIPTGSEVETYRTAHPLNLTLPIGIRFTW